MYHDFNYEATLASSLRAQWQLDDVLRVDQDLDFSRNFMPESLSRTAAISSLNPFEQRTLNQISAHQYLSIFGVVEEFILPFLLDHARPHLTDDDWRVRALLNFAGEEAKHIHLFKRYHAAFVRGFPVEVEFIGPSEAIGAEILRHDPLAAHVGCRSHVRPGDRCRRVQAQPLGSAGARGGCVLRREGVDWLTAWASWSTPPTRPSTAT